jgi:hypothetical protein
MAGDITVAAVIDSGGALTGARSFNAALGSMRKGVEAAALSTKSLISSMASVRGAAAGFIAALAVREVIQLGSAFSKAGDTSTQFKSRLALYAQDGVNATNTLDALAEAANLACAGQCASTFILGTPPPNKFG